MKYYLLILLVCLASCAAPVSYVNNVPRAASLNEKGDCNLNLSLGSDLTSRYKTVQVGGAWSPVQNFGVDFEYSGYLRAERSEEQLDKLSFWNGSLVYYLPLGDESTLEFKLGGGKGRAVGLVEIIQFPSIIRESFNITSRYNTIDFQTSYNLIEPEGKTNLSLGFRLRNIHFDEYTYDKVEDGFPTGESFSQNNWDVFIADPFVESNQALGKKMYLNTRVSYSFFNGEVVNGFRHPFHRRLGFSLGLQYRP